MLMLIPGMASAKPERMALKSDETKVREERARALARKIDLSKVDDPDTRRILSAILGAVDLNSRKPTAAGAMASSRGVTAVPARGGGAQRSRPLTENETHAAEILEHGRKVQ